MLPILMKKQAAPAGIIIENRKPDQKPEDKDDNGLSACADDLIKAVHAKDVKGVAQAMQALFDICSSQPDDESNDYDSQNQKAAAEEQE